MDGNAELIRLTELLRLGSKTVRQIAQLRSRDRARLSELADQADHMATELDEITGSHQPHEPLH